MKSKPGAHVSLVGAGPGDPGLLTLRALRALETADVLLYDALVSDAVLALVPARCARVFVGKRGAEQAMPQDEIEALMIREAAHGRRVVRLKGGDPFVFGRGGEEAQALRAAGIPFDVVPGISSALAAPAYAGIPLTHRAYNAAFTVASGREDPTKPGSLLDWEKLANPHATLVFLMAAGNLGEIAEKLIAHGLPASTPAAVVQDGTRPTQRTCAGTLATIAADAKRAGIGAPAVAVFGDVVRLRAEVAWFDRLPLFGKRVLVTRPAAQAEDFALALTSHGAEPVRAPTIVLEPPGDLAAAHRCIDELSSYAWIVFTSVNGVDAFFDRLASLDADARYLGGVKVAAIGAKTAARLGRFGVRPDVMPAEFVGEEIARALIEAAHTGDRVLVYRAQEARDILPQMLADAGLEPIVVAAYRSTNVRDAHFRDKVAGCDVLTFTSAGTVRGYVEQFENPTAAAAAARGRVVACIGPITAEAVQAAGMNVDVVATPYTTQALLEALEAHFTTDS
jgi:uroporphyrinogen III methyltransferase / synthase